MGNNEYVPTTEEVKSGFVWCSQYWDARSDAEDEANAEFDRWLAAHDQAVKAEAWEEGKLRGKEIAAWAIGDAPEQYRPSEANPYRADELEGK